MHSQPGAVRARVPLRLGLAGGGTDLSPYCDEYGGAVLNTTIDRYAYAFIEPSADGLVHFVAPDLELEQSIRPGLDALAEARLELHAGAAHADAVRRRATAGDPGDLLCRCPARLGPGIVVCPGGGARGGVHRLAVGAARPL